MGDPAADDRHVADQVFQIRAATGYQVSIEFGSDERIESVAVGDSGAWQATANRRGQPLFVKPIQSGVSTNMTVVTDVRIYAFDLMPGGSGDRPIRFDLRYPGANPVETAGRGPAGAAAGPPPAERRGRFGRAGSATTARTYIEWPRQAPFPPSTRSTSAAGRWWSTAICATIVRHRSGGSRLVFRIDDHVSRGPSAWPWRRR
jgi:type IV secretion system protein VirB9